MSKVGKVGQLGKAITPAKWPVWLKNKNKNVRNMPETTLERH